MKDDFIIYNNTNFNIKNYKKNFNEIFKKIKILLNIKQPLELSLIIVNAKKQLKLNKKYRNKNYIADVIVFSLEEKKNIDLFKLTGIRILGDIFICYEKALSQSIEYKHSLSCEFSFLFTHGILHILGYDHKNINDKKKCLIYKLKYLIIYKLKKLN